MANKTMTMEGHPQAETNFISKLTLWWIVDLLWRGNKNPLNFEDLYPVKEEDRVEHHTKRLEKIWGDEKTLANKKQRKLKLWKTMLRYITWKEYGILLFCCCSTILGSIFLRYFVLKLMEALNGNFANDTRSENVYFLYVWGMIISFLVERFGIRHFNLMTPTLGIRFRAAVLGLIYQKVRLTL